MTESSIPLLNRVVKLDYDPVQLLIGDGLYWSLPAERLRREFPYCYGDMEMRIPNYGVPGRIWQKVVFSHD